MTPRKTALELLYADPAVRDAELARSAEAVAGLYGPDGEIEILEAFGERDLIDP